MRLADLGNRLLNPGRVCFQQIDRIGKQIGTFLENRHHLDDDRIGRHRISLHGKQG